MKVAFQNKISQRDYWRYERIELFHREVGLTIISYLITDFTQDRIINHILHCFLKHGHRFIQNNRSSKSGTMQKSGRNFT